MQRIGLMGGSFNPVHLGHVNLARAALEARCVDSVLFLPTGNPPHKRSGLADKLDRLAMVELAVAGEADMGVCREEVDREGVIYTVDTLGILREKMPECAFSYIIGADSLQALHTWKRPQELIALCRFLVVMRPGEDVEKTLEAAQFWRARGAEIDFLDAPLMDISSTEIRRRIAAGEGIDDLVPAGAAAYIRTHGLYGTENKPDETRKDGI